ncbi:MAG: hypothetical protein PVJ39_14970 [Gammaproteobacteria bacterium]|jgi:hypothetical protein
MNRHKIIFLLTLLAILFAVSCNAPNGRSARQGTTVKLAAAESGVGGLDCGIDSRFKNAILKKDFTISGPEQVTQSEIPNIPDNIKAVKRIYGGKEDIFDSFSTLSRFMIKNNKSNVNARFYCFQFANAKAATTWFNVVDKAGPTSERFVVFRKPKKLMALTNNKVFLVEGYHIATYEPLHFILAQLPGVQAVLGPEKTVTP